MATPFGVHIDHTFHSVAGTIATVAKAWEVECGLVWIRVRVEVRVRVRVPNLYSAIGVFTCAIAAMQLSFF